MSASYGSNILKTVKFNDESIQVREQPSIVKHSAIRVLGFRGSLLPLHSVMYAFLGTA